MTVRTSMDESLPAGSGKPGHGAGVRVKVDWPTIKRQRVIENRSMASLAREHGIAARTIKAREEREDWPTEKRLEKAAQRIESLRLAIGDNFSIFSGDKEKLDALRDKVTNAKESHQDYTEFVYALCFQGLKHFGIAAPIPQTWRDAEILDRMARRAAGLDTQEVTQNPLINVAVLNLSGNLVSEIGGQGEKPESQPDTLET